MPPARNHFASDATRFIIAGVLNTGLTTLIYLAGLFVVPSAISYAVAWMVGIAFVMKFYPGRVFVGGDRSYRGRVSLGLLTIVVFLIGLALLRTLIGQGVGPRVAFLVTLIVTTAINFFGGRALSRRAA